MIRCGFFNSVNNDKTYDAEDMGKIFEGIISDGVFNNINKGNSFKVTKNNNTMTVNVAAGKAWFYNRYFEIVGNETITLRNGDINPRWDAICIKIDNSSSVREGSLYVYEGEPNAEPVKPTVTSTDDIKLIPIAYIKIPANSVNVNNAVITSTIGTRLCPYSEPSLDPRRAMYAFEGETSEASIFNYTVKQKNFTITLNQNINRDDNKTGKKGYVDLTAEDLGVDNINNIYIMGGMITDADEFLQESAYYDVYSINYGVYSLLPLRIKKYDNEGFVRISTRCDNVARSINNVTVNGYLIIIVEEEI